MIVFDLDCLVDDSHRRHFIDPSKDLNLRTVRYKYGSYVVHTIDNPYLFEWKPDFASYEASAGDDKPIEIMKTVLYDIMASSRCPNIELWTSRCGSTRKITEDWLDYHFEAFFNSSVDDYKYLKMLKMRPDGEDIPQEMLFERWLNERCADLMTAQINGENPVKHDIDMVFSSHKPTIDMFRHRGVFVFDCNQGIK